MNTLKYTLVAAALLTLAAPAAAQSEEERQRELVEAERALARAEREREIALAEAERQLERAAQRIAELSTRRLPRVAGQQQMFIEFMGKPRLGVTVGSDSDDNGPVEGTKILGVTPGSAAADAGLRAGDILTSINNESLSASSAEAANERLTDFMAGVEEGDTLDIEYLRNGNVGNVTVEPRIMQQNAFVFAPDVEVHTAPSIDVVPPVAGFRFGTMFIGGAWSDLELIELSEGLGRYFGTDSGLLVVKAPSGDGLKLEDGDVIQSIDGREPTSVGHALRILSSYQAGESMELRIMRDKKRQTLKVEMPDERTGYYFDNGVPAPVAPVAAPKAASPVIVIDEST